MNGLIMAAQLIAGLSILVVLHELGHYLAARAFGIKVEKFFLFFDAWGIKLFSFKKGDTEYGVGWLPLGGYVKIAGMIDESMDTEAMKQPPQSWEFRTKPAWQRLIVMLGGVFVNVVVGIVIFAALILKNGETYLPNENAKYGIVAYSAAQSIGLQNGDKITAVNGKPVERFNDLLGPEVLYGNVNLTVYRNGKDTTVFIPGNFIETLTEDGQPFILPRTKFIVGQVLAGSNAERGGLEAGDEITSIDGKSVTYFDQLQAALKQYKGEVVTAEILRDKSIQTLNIQVTDEGTIGFKPQETGLDYNVEHYGIFQSVILGSQKAYLTLIGQAQGFAKMFKGEVKATNAIQGPIGIAQIYGSSFEWDSFWALTGLISLVLAFMNILPIPALDGGHSLFLIIEIIKGSPLSDRFMERAQMVGFVILMSLMVFAFGNDLFKIFIK